MVMLVDILTVGCRAGIGMVIFNIISIPYVYTSLVLIIMPLVAALGVPLVLRERVVEGWVLLLCCYVIYFTGCIGVVSCYELAKNIVIMIGPSAPVLLMHFRP